MNNFINVTLPKDFDSKKYENKNIIIVGGGPSTNDVHWEDLDYDFIFSCNFLIEFKFNLEYSAGY